MGFKHRISLDDLAARAGKSINYSACIDQIGQKIRAGVMRNFDELHGPDGRPWAPRKHPRPNSRGADRPLNDTGMLRSSVTVPGSRGNIFTKTSNSLLAGTNLEYGPIHQYGGTIKPKKAKFLAIPATVEAQRIGSPRNWPEGSLRFRFGKNGGVAVADSKKGLADVVQYYFSKQVTIPARPYLGINEEQEADFAELVAEHAANAVVDNLVGSGGV